MVSLLGELSVSCRLGQARPEAGSESVHVVRQWSVQGQFMTATRQSNVMSFQSQAYTKRIECELILNTDCQHTWTCQSTTDPRQATSAALFRTTCSASSSWKKRRVCGNDTTSQHAMPEQGHDSLSPHLCALMQRQQI